MSGISLVCAGLIVLPISVRALQDEDRELHRILERALADKPSAKAEVARKVVLLIKQKRGDIRELLVVMGKTGIDGSPYINEILPLLVDEDVRVRREVAFTVGRLCDAKIKEIDLALLTNGLHDKDESVREYTVFAFGKMRQKSWEHRREVQKLLFDSSPSVAVEAAWALFRITDDEKPVLPGLVNALDNEATISGSLCAISEIGLRARSTWPIVAPLTENKNWFVRGLAIDALCKIDDDPAKVLGFVVRAQGDSEPLVGAIAIRGFQRFQKRGAESIIARLRKSTDIQEMERTIEVLGNMREYGADGLKLLRELSRHENARIRHTALEAIRQIEGKRGNE
jgi:HEAT repeat protein